MKLITRIDKRTSPFRAPASKAGLGGTTIHETGRRTAQIREEATQKYEAALKIYGSGGCRLREIEHASIERMRARAVVPEVREAKPTLPAAAGDAATVSAVFRSRGEFWTVGFPGEEAFFKDRKGLHYIADLLRYPGVEIHSFDLIVAGRHGGESPIDDDDDSTPPVVPRQSDYDFLGSPGTAGPLLDRRAKIEYQRRLSDLRDEIEMAEAKGDRAYVVARLEEEAKALRQELRRAFGLHGRERFACDDQERARVNVTRHIRLAVDRIADVNADLGEHLDSSIRTGGFCCYRPTSSRPINWSL